MIDMPFPLKFSKSGVLDEVPEGSAFMSEDTDLRRRSRLVVSASDCDVRGPAFEAHRGQLCHPDGHCLGHGLRIFTAVNPALHFFGVGKSSASYGWGKGGKVTSAGWQVTLCDSMWHVSSRSGGGGGWLQ